MFAPYLQPESAVILSWHCTPAISTRNAISVCVRVMVYVHNVCITCKCGYDKFQLSLFGSASVVQALSS